MNKTEQNEFYGLNEMIERIQQDAIVSEEFAVMTRKILAKI